MPADASIYGLQQPAPRINTPFENLAQVLQVRNQQEAAAGLREQRQGLAEQRRTEAEQKRQEAQAAAQFRALWSRTDPTTGQPLPPTLEEATSVIGDKAVDVFKGIEAIKKSQWENEQAAVQGIASVLGGLEAWPAPDRPAAYASVRQTLIQQGKIKPEDAPETYDAKWVGQMRRQALTVAQQFEQDKPPADYTLGDSRISGATNQPIATAPPKPEKVTYGAPQTLMVNGRRSAVRAGSDGRMYDMNLKPIAGEAIAPEPKTDGQAKPTYEWAQTPEGTRLMTPEEIRKQGATKPAVGAVGDNKFSTAAPVLEGIKELSEKINTGEGLLAKMGGGAAKIAAKANYDDDVAEYEALVSGFTPLVARALGHTGVLTQQDVDSVKALFPQPGNSKTLRDRKIKRVEGIISKLEGAPKPGAAPSAKPPAGETPEQRIKRLVGGG